MFDTETARTDNPPDTAAAVTATTDPVAVTHRAIETLRGEALAELSPAALGDRVRELAALAERVEAELVRAVGQWDAVEAWASDDPPRLSARAWLSDNTAMTGARASRLVRAARLAYSHDATGEALADGEVSVGHVEQLASVVTQERAELYPEHESTLLANAKRLSVDWYTRALRHWKHLADDALQSDDPFEIYQRRGLYVSTTSDMGLVDGRLDLEAIAWLQAALEAAERVDTKRETDGAGETDADNDQGDLTPAQRRADALVELARAYLAGEHGKANAEVLFHIDPATYLGITSRGTNFVAGAASPHAYNRGATNAGALNSHDPAGLVEGVAPTALGSLAPHGRLRDGPALPAPSGAGATACGTAGGDVLPGPDRPGVGPISELDGYGPIPPETIRRACCDGALRRVIVDARGEILDLGRRVRLASPAQRRAVTVRDRHCVFPGCSRPARWCDVHHVTEWEHGGSTDLDNLCLLCRHHHVLVHEGRWQLRRHHHTWTASRPDTKSGPRTHDPPAIQAA